MADTGRTVFADGFFADGLFAVGFFAADAPVTVPDVVGETQAAGTATLEGDGFVVAVETAYSSTVAAGLIISQVPAGGASAASGSTVTITVSLGDAPQPPQQEVTGGWAFWADAERHRRERERRRRRQLEIEEETREIEEAQAREIARLMREQEERDAERAELDRLQKLADRYAGQRIGLPRKVVASLINAQEMRTYAALMQLQREIAQMLEAEEMALLMILLTAD